MSDIKRVSLGGGLLICLWVPMVALIIWGKGGVLDLIEIRQEVANLEAEIKTLQRDNQLLAEDIKRFEADPSAYEGPARHLLLKKKPGEIVLYLPRAGAPAAKSTTTTPESSNTAVPPPVTVAATPVEPPGGVNPTDAQAPPQQAPASMEETSATNQPVQRQEGGDAQR